MDKTHNKHHLKLKPLSIHRLTQAISFTSRNTTLNLAQQSARNLSKPIHHLKSFNTHSLKRHQSIADCDTFFQSSESYSIKRHKSIPEMHYKEHAWNATETPYSPSDVLLKFQQCLSPFEQQEIHHFKSIYYIAPTLVKDHQRASKNSGFDDENNDLILTKRDHLAYRFEILKVIGKGAFGKVVKAIDHKEKKRVAVKVLKSSQKLAQKGRTEVQVLFTLLKNAEPSNHVIHLKEYFNFRGHVLLVFDLLDIDLSNVIRINGACFPLQIIKTYAEQILEGIFYYERCGIIHCDLKPENIMVNKRDNKAVIIDFGSACFTSGKVYNYIQSRFYRAPEVLLNIGYSIKIDVWSLGCIVAELALGRPLFSGKDDVDQILSLIEVLGLPPSQMLEASDKHEAVLDQLKRSQGCKFKRCPGSKPIKSIFSDYDALFQDFLLKTLAWNPYDRINPKDALNHHWFRANIMKRFDSLAEFNAKTKARLAGIVLSSSKLGNHSSQKIGV